MARATDPRRIRQLGVFQGGQINLVAPVRGDNGYRSFRERDPHRLTFLARARSLGFSLDDCRPLLALYDDRASPDVKALASDHLSHIDRKIAELEGLRATLKHLVDRCHGDDGSDCPILDDIAMMEMEAAERWDSPS